jgi:hypothetical protein
MYIPPSNNTKLLKYIVVVNKYLHVLRFIVTIYILNYRSPYKKMKCKHWMMVSLSLWQIGQLVSYVKTLLNLNIIRHIKFLYSIRLNFQNLQRANMSSTKHACGGTCRLDSQLLTASTFYTKLHLSSSCSSNRLLKKWCVDDMAVAVRHKIVIRFLNHPQTNTNETHTISSKLTCPQQNTPAAAHVD